MRKNATKIAALALTLALTVTSVNIPTNASAATVKLNKKKATLYVSGAKSKKTTTLKVTGTKKKVTFTSNKKSVATVNKKGKVTAKKAGKATITAKVGKKSYKCTVTVKKKYTPVTSVSVSPKTVSLKVGKTKTIKATVKPSKPTEKGVTYKSSKTSVATVSSKGKITAKKAGKATITVTAKGASKSGSNKKATVAVTVTKDDTKPTDAPSTAPSDAPTDAPSTAPTDAPSTAPTTLGKITELKATKSTQLTATFDSAVPADTKIEVSKGSSAVEGETKIDGSTVTFDTTANLTAGTYTLTATLGETKVSADVDVKDSHVAEIKITSKEALTKDVETTTGAAMKEAFIYYDVFNQYGESIKNSTTIDWTTSVGNGDKKVDKSLGKITVKAEQSALNYGSQIYVTGVHSTSGTVINTSIPVGMAQAVDSIEFAGFLNKNDKTKLLENLPADFQKDTYYLLYKAFDQNGSPYEISDIESDSLTFIADQPLLLSLEDTKDSDGKVQIPTFTVKGEEYAAIRVQPGQYVDKGGEVNITVIANKTGTKKTQNFVIGSSGILQSFTLSAPASTVADGDRDVKIPYVAKDVSGNTITNYETIVRSTNSLQLTATDGKLKVKEENDGTAGVYWSDSKYDPEKEEAYSSTAVCDGVVRNISLNTVVMSGESSNLMLEVSDIRRPDAIKSLKLNDDNNDTIVSGNEAKMSVKKGDIIFLDQYGAELDSKKAKAFFGYAGKNSFGKGNEAGYYGIRVVNTSTGSKDKLGIGTNGSKVYKYSGADLAIDIAATTTEKDDNTVKYSIARAAKSDASVNSMSAWDDASKVKSVTYTIVPVKNLKNFTVSGLNNRIQITTDLSEEINGEAVTGSSFSAKKAVPVSEVTSNDNAIFKVQGTCDGKTVTLPNTAYQAKDSTGSKEDSNFEGSAFDVGAISYNIEESSLTNVTGGALLWSDIYDFNAYGKPRKDAKINLEITIPGGGNASKSVTISDALESPVSVVFSRDYKSDIKEYTLNPVYGEINGSDLDSAGKIVDAAREIAYNGQHHVSGEDAASGKHTGTKLVPVCNLEYTHPGELVVYYVDQYGVKHADPDKIEFTVSDIVENTDTALAHVPDSFIVNSNGTTKTTISGAEIGDTFKLTAKVKGTDITASIKVVVGADKGAYIDEDGGSASKTGKQTLGKIDSTNAGAKDKYLRELLGYSR